MRWGSSGVIFMFISAPHLDKDRIIFTLYNLFLKSNAFRSYWN